MNIVKIGSLEVGTGMPKVIVPIVAKDVEGIVAKAKELNAYTMDLVEWRVDFFEDVFDIKKTVEAARCLREALDKTPILFTFRTKKEGGEKEIDIETYTALNKALAESGYVDAVDVEIFSGDDVVKANIDNIHAAGKVVVGSNHDFFKTPDKDDLVSRLKKMQDLGADIPKIAVMPTSVADVLVLEAATDEFAHKIADRPIITMSMGPKGVITRIAGELFGSSMTFGAVGQVSAPGQIPVEKLQTAMAILHDAI